ncbi:hypothetical protein Scep_024588 [Stephania cephalantha]|uniref:Anoctamin transmembrane domain-containing protein n=1 Tax=Stephania cephalantha TaxID=152367 RepID=A0AAP0HTU1_9MAGN
MYRKSSNCPRVIDIVDALRPREGGDDEGEDEDSKRVSREKKRSWRRRGRDVERERIGRALKRGYEKRGLESENTKISEEKIRGASEILRGEEGGWRGRRGGRGKKIGWGTVMCGHAAPDRLLVPKWADSTRIPLKLTHKPTREQWEEVRDSSTPKAIISMFDCPDIKRLKFGNLDRRGIGGTGGEEKIGFEIALVVSKKDVEDGRDEHHGRCCSDCAEFIVLELEKVGLVVEEVVEVSDEFLKTYSLSGMRIDAFVRQPDGTLFSCHRQSTPHLALACHPEIILVDRDSLTPDQLSRVGTQSLPSFIPTGRTQTTLELLPSANLVRHLSSWPSVAHPSELSSACPLSFLSCVCAVMFLQFWKRKNSAMLARWKTSHPAGVGMRCNLVNTEKNYHPSHAEQAKKVEEDKLTEKQAYQRDEWLGHLLRFRNDAFFILIIICLQLPFGLAYAHLYEIAGSDVWADYCCISFNHSVLDKDQGQDFLELALQFGMIMMFACAFPLAFCLAALSNAAEIRTDALKLLACDEETRSSCLCNNWSLAKHISVSTGDVNMYQLRTPWLFCMIRRENGDLSQDSLQFS